MADPFNATYQSILMTFQTVNQAASLALSLYSEVKKQIPRLEDEVVVEVRGQPGATKQQLYYLALSAAFGVTRRFDISIGGTFIVIPSGMLMCEYDATENWVRATVRFNTGMVAAALASAFQSPGAAALVPGAIVAGAVASYMTGVPSNKSLPYYAQMVIYSGPKDEVVGGPFNFVGALTPGVPDSAYSRGAPNLPFEGRTILTTSPTVKEPVPKPYQSNNTVPTPNPKPPGDNRSRGTFPIETASPSDERRGLTFSAQQDALVRALIPLVYASLTDNGFEQRFVDPVAGPTGG